MPNAFDLCLKDPWILKFTAQHTAKHQLSIDTLHNLKRYNMQGQFEILLDLIRKDYENLIRINAFGGECFEIMRNLSSSESAPYNSGARVETSKDG